MVKIKQYSHQEIDFKEHIKKIKTFLKIVFLFLQTNYSLLLLIIIFFMKGKIYSLNHMLTEEEIVLRKSST